MAPWPHFEQSRDKGTAFHEVGKPFLWGSLQFMAGRQRCGRRVLRLFLLLSQPLTLEDVKALAHAS